MPKKKLKQIKVLSFQEIIMNLQKFWINLDALFFNHTISKLAQELFIQLTLRSLGTKPWKAAYVRHLKTNRRKVWRKSNRLQHYYQFQVIIKPSPKNIKQIYLKSLASIGIDVDHDIRFGDDWESPCWELREMEVWCDGMEITQFTYFQQMTGLVQ